MDAITPDSSLLELLTHDDGSPCLLGKGAFAEVHKGRYLGNNVAVKILPLNTDENREAWSQEAGMLNLLRVNRHDNIVESHSFSNNSLTKAFIVMEFMEGGTLAQALRPTGPSPMITWNSGGRNLALQVVCGLSHLHAHKVLHRDIKPQNILLNASRTTAKIGDVGLSRLVNNNSISFGGTLGYIAPEILRVPGADRVDEKADIFSMGVMMWEMLTNQYLDPCSIRKILGFSNWEASDGSAIISAVQDCLGPQKDRPTAQQLYDRIADSPVEVDLQLLRLALFTARVSQASPPASLQPSEATHVDSSSGDNMPLLQSSELRSAECGSSSKAQSPGTQKDEKSRNEAPQKVKATGVAVGGSITGLGCTTFVVGMGTFWFDMGATLLVGALLMGVGPVVGAGVTAGNAIHDAVRKKRELQSGGKSCSRLSCSANSMAVL
ncbi:g9122 [Coccomyxa viridis]|uniref:G9122 protein n=1 Tax=Coccomyxa viridis TaxID=1274662 RepID=A0ABP1G4Q1_9CHLO